MDRIDIHVSQIIPCRAAEAVPMLAAAKARSELYPSLVVLEKWSPAADV
jgi:hypothetical protein